MRAVGRAVLVAAVTAVLALWAWPAAVDEEGASDEARVLVVQAIALIVNTPDDMHRVTAAAGRDATLECAQIG